jgi:hypothetical protein
MAIVFGMNKITIKNKAEKYFAVFVAFEFRCKENRTE